MPNRAAIRLLGTSEDEIREQFLRNLSACRTELAQDQQVRGQIVAGGFGSGKSHLLGYLQELALQDGFIVSRVSISKETPLSDAGKLYLSALRSAVVPEQNDDPMTAVVKRLKPRSPAYEELEGWSSREASGLSPLFSALLHLIPRQQTTPDRLNQIARFLAGGKLGVSMVKKWLSESGASKLFQLKAVREGELTRQRLRFVPRLIAASGYAGWCVLLDEVELIGRYSAIQRGRSYAELARWLGLDRSAVIPGVVAVAAVTDDFKDVVIGQRRDDELVPAKLLAKGERAVADLASIGLRALESDVILLQSPDTSVLQRSLEKTRNLYSKAYDWQPPSAEIGEQMQTKSMRQYMKSWITEWDLERLYGTRPEILTETIVQNYEEDRDIEMPPDGSEEEPESEE